MFVLLLVSKISLQNLSRTSPKPLQNRDPKKLSLRVYIYIYIYMIWEQPGLTMEREAPFSFIA